MLKRTKTIVLLLAILVFANISNAQNLDETLSQLAKNAAIGYVEPISSAFGSNLNSGWFHKAPEAKVFGLSLNLKIVGTGTFIDDKPKTFTTSGNFKVTSSQADDILIHSGYDKNHPAFNALKTELLSKEWSLTFSGPTIIGKKTEKLQVFFPGGTVGGQAISPYTTVVSEVKGLLDEMTIFPLAVPQLTVGTVMGSNLSIRYVAGLKAQDIGDIKLLGFGLTHNPNVWFANPLPVDVSLAYFYQNLDAGSKVVTKSSQFGVYVSKKFGESLALIPYAGYTVETAKTEVNYDYEYDSVVNGVPIKAKDKISFELEGENKGSFLVGATIKTASLNINFDYKLAKYKTVCIGISFDLL